MNRIALRRRWLLARPWVSDASQACILIALAVIAFKFLPVLVVAFWATIEAWHGAQ